MVHSAFITYAQFSNFVYTNIVLITSEALHPITENTAILLSEAQRQDDDDRDPFADLDDDGEELETNELLVEDWWTIPVIPDCSSRDFCIT